MVTLFGLRKLEALTGRRHGAHVSNFGFDGHNVAQVWSSWDQGLE
jgi:hypothetical protein